MDAPSLTSANSVLSDAVLDIRRQEPTNGGVLEATIVSGEETFKWGERGKEKKYSETELGEVEENIGKAV
jgi:hypothetical protein